MSETFKQGDEIFFVNQIGPDVFCLKWVIQEKKYCSHGLRFLIRICIPKYCSVCGEGVLATIRLNDVFLCDACGEKEVNTLKERNNNRGGKNQIEIVETEIEQTGFGDFLELIKKFELKKLNMTRVVTEDDLKRTKAEAIAHALEWYRDIVKKLKVKPVGD